MSERLWRTSAGAGAMAALFFGLTLSLVAQTPRGPIAPSPAPSGASQPARSVTPEAPGHASSARHTSSPISPELPSAPVDQIIRQFAASEAEFQRERGNFTYTQTMIVQTLDADARPDGEFRMTSDIVFTPRGQRYEKIKYAPAPTLERITLSQQDFDDLRNVQPFVLTTEELPKYEVKYVGRQQVDELRTYVFDVAPKKIEKNQRYFQGRIWVDDKDLQIVKTFGKAVPDIIKKNNENIFPKFETYRENIEGHYWFPTYTRADDNLHFKTGDVRIRMTVRYSNYKRFGATIKMSQPTPVEPDHP